MGFHEMIYFHCEPFFHAGLLVYWRLHPKKGLTVTFVTSGGQLQFAKILGLSTIILILSALELATWLSLKLLTFVLS